MEGRAFYDIHCHAMNLSHPNFTALVQRMNAPFVLAVFAPAASIFMRDKIEKTKNLLCVMENDMGNFFLNLESCFIGESVLWHEMEGRKVLRIGDLTYGKVILTPLLMDFGQKDMLDNGLACRKPVQKPIVEQVVDVFGGIRDYINGSQYRILEIYPFLGINTKNYTQEKISIMLNKYFGSYNSTYTKLKSSFDRLSSFDGDIEKLGSNHFSGIKLYPPIGFDPWPEKDGAEREKVELLYRYCVGKNIPITVHCNDGGFVVGDARDSERRTAPSIWENVLRRYPKLKINFGHMGKTSKLWRKLFKKDAWARQIIEMILKYDNVYTDFSYCGLGEGYYKSLRKLIDSYSEKQKKKLTGRIMFGSDYMINLLSVDSYGQYIKIFSDTKSLSEQEKYKFACENPGGFLLSKN